MQYVHGSRHDQCMLRTFVPGNYLVVREISARFCVHVCQSHLEIYRNKHQGSESSTFQGRQRRI